MIAKLVYRVTGLLYKGFNKVFIIPGLKESMGSCGKNVRIAYNCDIKLARNVYMGNNSQIGPHSLFWTTKARIIIGNYVLMGPHVTIITGNHRTDIVGKHIQEITDEDKRTEDDEDVVIEDGVWIASNTTILKGVVIGEGSIIAAGSIVTKSVEPYTIYGGVPAKKIKNRFTDKELEEHIKMLNLLQKRSSNE